MFVFVEIVQDTQNNEDAFAYWRKYRNVYLSPVIYGLVLFFFSINSDHAGRVIISHTRNSQNQTNSYKCYAKNSCNTLTL